MYTCTYVWTHLILVVLYVIGHIGELDSDTRRHHASAPDLLLCVISPRNTCHLYYCPHLLTLLTSQKFTFFFKTWVIFGQTHRSDLDVISEESLRYQVKATHVRLSQKTQSKAAYKFVKKKIGKRKLENALNQHDLSVFQLTKELLHMYIYIYIYICNLSLLRAAAAHSTAIHGSCMPYNLALLALCAKMLCHIAMSQWIRHTTLCNRELSWTASDFFSPFFFVCWHSNMPTHGVYQMCVYTHTYSC